MTTDSSQKDMLSIQLSLAKDTERYVVDSVDIHQPNFRHRLSFTRDKEVEAILSPKLADYINALLAKVDQDRMVFSIPDAVVDLPDLVLGKLRVLVHTAQDKTRQVIVRFSYFIGGVQAAFKVATHFKLPSISHREALAVSALHDICIPVFDVVSSAVTGLFDDGMRDFSPRERLSKLADVESDLLFYLQLLKRYVATSHADGLTSDDDNVLSLGQHTGMSSASATA